MSATITDSNSLLSAPEPPSVQPLALRETLQSGALSLDVWDVRRAKAFASQPVLLEGAKRVAPWMIPAQLGALRKQRPAQPVSCHLVVMVCVYGHAVSQTAYRLAHCHGFQAAYLDGGLDAWLRAGLPVKAYEGLI